MVISEVFPPRQCCYGCCLSVFNFIFCNFSCVVFVEYIDVKNYKFIGVTVLLYNLLHLNMLYGT